MFVCCVVANIPCCALRLATTPWGGYKMLPHRGGCSRGVQSGVAPVLHCYKMLPHHGSCSHGVQSGVAPVLLLGSCYDTMGVALTVCDLGLLQYCTTCAFGDFAAFHGNQ